MLRKWLGLEPIPDKFGGLAVPRELVAWATWAELPERICSALICLDAENLQTGFAIGKAPSMASRDRKPYASRGS